VADLVAVAGIKALLNARRIDVNAQKTRPVHRRGKRLSAAHPASAGDDKLPSQGGACIGEVFRAGRRERLGRAFRSAVQRWRGLAIELQ